MTKQPITLMMALLASAVFSLARAETIYVSADGKDGAAGTKESPLAGLGQAADRAKPGDVIRVSGTFKLAHTVPLRSKGTESQPIRVQPDGGARPVFDFSAEEFKKEGGIELRRDWWQIVGIEVIGSGRTGINITGHHNIIESCIAHENQDTGIHIGQPGSYNLILRCDSYRNVDRPTVGENADGFGCKFNVGPGNVFRECRAWENADDGFDLWKAPQPVRIENCVAFRNGLNLWNIQGFTGNGNGFKLGGDFVPAEHVVVNCVAMDQPQRGFDQNNNMGALTVINCTALRCKTGFSFSRSPLKGEHFLKRNVAVEAPVRLVAGTVEEDNQWLGDKPTPVPSTRPAARN
jgi:hypothetical protein